MTGDSVGELVASFKVNRTTRARASPTEWRPRGATGPKLSDDDVAEAADLYRAGMSLAPSAAAADSTPPPSVSGDRIAD